MGNSNIKRNRIRKILFFFILTSLPFCHFTADVEFPLIQSLGYIPFSESDIIQKKTISLFLDTHYSNIYMFDQTMYTVNDMEVLNNTVGFRYGLGKTITAELYYRFLVVYGGFLDSVAESVHDIFAFENDGRKVFPRNTVHYKFKNYFYYQNSVFTHSPLIAALLWRLMKLGDFSFKLRAAMGIPLSSKPGFNNDSPFFITGLIIEFSRHRNFLLELSNYVTFFNQPSWLGTEDLRNSLWFSQLKMGVKRFCCGLLFKKTPFKVGDLANHAWQFFVGYRINKMVEISVFEEFAPMDTTPDITFNIRVKLK